MEWALAVYTTAMLLCAAAATVVALVHIFLHLVHYVEPIPNALRSTLIPVYAVMSFLSLSFIVVSTGLSAKGTRVSSRQMPLVAKQVNSSKDKQIEGGGGSSSSSFRLPRDYLQSTRARHYLDATRHCKEYGIWVPGAFRDRGTTGKIIAAKYARENNVPYVVICLGMHITVIEFAPHVVNFPDVNPDMVPIFQNAGLQFIGTR